MDYTSQSRYFTLTVDWVDASVRGTAGNIKIETKNNNNNNGYVLPDLHSDLFLQIQLLKKKIHLYIQLSLCPSCLVL